MSSLSAIRVRAARPEDAAAIAAIFNEEVERGNATYETVAHTASQRRAWLEMLNEKDFPALVAETDPDSQGPQEPKVAGFAALTPFHPARGYRFTATAQIYLTADARGRGLGTRLAHALRELAVQKGFHTVIAGVNSRNTACRALLEGFGFVQVGHFKQIGFKNGEWFDDICFQLVLPEAGT